MENLKHKTVKGTLWSSIERFATQAVSFVVMIIMASLLTPEDYGLVAMLTIFIAISQSLVDSGFSNALIRKQDRDETDNSTVFYFNIAVGILLYLLIFFSAPLIAAFYKQPLLVPIARIMSLSIIINGLAIIQRTVLTGRLDFKTQAKASFSGAVVSGIIGIAMAYIGYGVWSIVAYHIASITTSSVLLWFLSRWRPKLVYSWKSFRELFGFGSKLAISGIIDTLYNNVYLLVIGKVFNAADLGYYTRASQFAQFPSSNITGILQRVTYPVLCTMQDDDYRLRYVYRRFLRLSAFVVFPLMMGLAAVAKPLILLLLKEQWAFCIILLQIMCFSMMWYPIHAINLNLLQVKGRSDLFLKLEILKKIVGVTILCIALPFGLVAMCVSGIFSSIICLIINTHYTGKLIQVGFLTQMKDLLPTILYSLSMSAIVYLVVCLIPNLWLQLFVGILVGVVYFMAVTRLTHSKDLDEAMGFIKEIKR